MKGYSTWRKKGTGRGMRISRCMLPTVGSCTQRQCPVRCPRGGESTARRPRARSRRARGRALDERAVAHAWRACESPESFPCLFIAVLGSPPHHLHLGCNMVPPPVFCWWVSLGRVSSISGPGSSGIGLGFFRPMGEGHTTIPQGDLTRLVSRPSSSWSFVSRPSLVSSLVSSPRPRLLVSGPSSSSLVLAPPRRDIIIAHIVARVVWGRRRVALGGVG